MHSKTHTLMALVANSTGVLAHITKFFGDHGYNIDALTVAPTHHDPRVSRITIVTKGNAAVLEKMVQELSQVEDISKVVVVHEEDYLCRELLLVKAKADHKNQKEVLKIIREVQGEILDEESGAIIAMLLNHPDQNDQAIHQLGAFGVIEVVRTGRVAIGKGKTAFRQT